MIVRLAIFTIFTALAIPLHGQADDDFLLRWARKVIAEGAAEKDGDARRDLAVAFSLASSKDPSTSTLQTLLTDKDYTVRLAAIASFGELGDKKFIPQIKTALDDDVPEVMFAAAQALFELGDPEGEKALVAVFEGETKAESGFFRSKFRDIARRLKTPKSAILFAAEQGASLVPVVGAGAGYSALSDMLDDSDFSPRAASLLQLSSRRTEETRKRVEGAFTDDDWSVRAIAIQIAAKWDERAWKARLIPLFQDEKRKVRFRAAAVFLRFSQI